MNKKIKKKKKGFTLIELIIVLAIVAIIAAIAIPNFTKVSSDSKTKADNQSKETIRRVVLTLVADDTIPVPTGDSLKGVLTFNTDKSIVGVTGAVFTPAVAAVAADPSKGIEEVKALAVNDVLINALKEVKAPQKSGKTFEIEVNSQGDVIVKTVLISTSSSTTTSTTTK